MREQDSSLEAVVLWRMLHKATRNQLLDEVWCPRCARLVPMCEAFGRVKKGDLILKGRCPLCFGRVTRVVETSLAALPPN